MLTIYHRMNGQKNQGWNAHPLYNQLVHGVERNTLRNRST
jgi:hypothetical protein